MGHATDASADRTPLAPRGAKRSPRASGKGREAGRPSSEELFAAVVDLLSGGAAAFKGTARRYSICAADAEDAYQRGLEILITKAPTSDRSELRPWLHTVIKHEALALRRQRERLLASGRAPAGSTAPESVAGPDEGAVERERVRQTAEALTQLKPSEVQCLLLKALGYSYGEIAARTGFSWTKVNRSLTEGRKRFFAGFTQIESGRRCRRLQPLISAACDGEGSAADLLRLKAHLRTCQGCRAVLRDYRALPERLAQLLPPITMLPAIQRAGWWSRLCDSVAGAAGDRTAALGYKLQATGEQLSAQKTAAVVASTAALAGGAAVQDRALEREDRQRASSSERANTRAAGVARAPASPGPATTPVPVQPPSTASTAGRKQKGGGNRARRSRLDGGEFGLGGTPVARSAGATGASAGSTEGPGSTLPAEGRDRGAAEFGPAGAAKAGGDAVGQEFAP
jgi:RNA polymerase sigma factor (sigma-70 family)